MSEQICPSCQSSKVTKEEVDHTFPYGLGASAVDLQVRIPVSTCADCKESFTGDDASIIMHNAVCVHLGIMTPDEVAAVRKQYGMSQQAFGRVTGFGSASLARWETAALLQNSSSDALLYLLRYPENMERLKARRDALDRKTTGGIS